MSPLASRSWRALHSAWVLWPLASMGALAWVGFLWVGLRVRRPAWWVAGLAYFAVTTLLFFGPFDGPAFDALIGAAIVAAWLGSTVHAVAVNPAWLRALAAQQERPWSAQAPSGALRPAPAAPLPAPAPPPSPLSPSAPVDVNTASAAVLADLEELNASQAEFVVAVRSARGPFPSVEVFADVAGLQPHQLARLRGRLVASGPQAPLTPPAGPPAGRVLGL